MNKTFAVSVIVMFFVSTLMGFVVHGLLIGADYARLTSLFRAHDDMMAHFRALALA
jgi:NhaP-type Na+/H+ or K+/H+ antiporter